MRFTFANGFFAVDSVMQRRLNLYEVTAKSSGDTKNNMRTPQQEPERYILVCVEKPTTEGSFPAIAKWLTLTNEIAKMPPQFSGFEKLCENEFLFPEKTHTKMAIEFLVFCRRTGLVCQGYRIFGKPEDAGY